MNALKNIIRVKAQHIEPTIKKYQGKGNAQLFALLKKAGYNYTPYIFNDGRILLALPYNTCAFLYPNEKVVIEFLRLKAQ